MNCKLCYNCILKNNCPIVGNVATYAINCIHKQIKKQPCFDAISRYKRMAIKDGKPLSEINDTIYNCFRRRGGHWFRTQLSWY